MKLIAIVFAVAFVCCSSLSYSSVIKQHSDGKEKGRVVVGEQPLSKIAIHKTVAAFRQSVAVKASPLLLGIKVYISVSMYIVICFILF